MTKQFDAYYKWFGIRPEHQPPDHYRLLGIQAFESDADVISNAADQRMSHLRSLQTGPHAAESQRILNEVSQARVTLLDAERKLGYDVALRKKIAAAAAAADAAVSARRSAATAKSNLDALDAISDEFSAELDASRRTAAETPVHSTRRAKKSSPWLALVSIALGAVLGLVLVYSLLGNLAGIDPLGIFPRRAADRTAEPDDDASAATTPGQQEAAPIAPPKAQNESAASTVPPRDNQKKPSTGERTAPTATQASGQDPRSRSAPPSATDVNPFADFPTQVALPPPSVAEPSVLARIHSDPAQIDDMLLDAEAADVDAGRRLELAQDDSPSARRWRIQLVDASAQADNASRTELAEVRIDGSVLSFKWLPAASAHVSAAQVQNCVLKLRAAEHETLLRLRVPAIRPAHVLDLSTAASRVEIPVDALPKPESLILEISPADVLPWAAEFKDERSRVPFVTPTREKIVVLLGAITDEDRPEFSIEPQATRKGMSVRIAPRIVNPKGESPFSLAQIAEVRKKYAALKIRTDKEWSELGAQKQALEKRAADLERQLRSGGGPRTPLQRELAQVNARLSQTNAAFKKVDADKVQFDGVLDALPPAEHSIAELHKKAKVPYRVLAKVGAAEIELVRAIE